MSGSCWTSRCGLKCFLNCQRLNSLMGHHCWLMSRHCAVSWAALSESADGKNSDCISCFFLERSAPMSSMVSHCWCCVAAVSIIPGDRYLMSASQWHSCVNAWNEDSFRPRSTPMSCAIWSASLLSCFTRFANCLSNSMICVRLSGSALSMIRPYSGWFVGAPVRRVTVVVERITCSMCSMSSVVICLWFNFADCNSSHSQVRYKLRHSYSESPEGCLACSSRT